MRTAAEVAAQVVARAVEPGVERGLMTLVGIDPELLRRHLTAALEAYARDHFAGRLREALGSGGPVGEERLEQLREWCEPVSPGHGLSASEGRQLFAALDHARALLLAYRHESGHAEEYERGRRAGAAEQHRRDVEAAWATARAWGAAGNNDFVTVRVIKAVEAAGGGEG
jgi:hypothetical protein